MRRAAAAPALLLAACTGGSGGLTPGGCDGHCADTPTRLTVADVQAVIAQGVAEAAARGAPATIAVVDRVGNVLGVFRMNGADTLIATDAGRGVSGGLDGLDGATLGVPDTLAAISKAITAAFLSSEGNAFTTRTASQIIQLHFYPGENGQPSGPLYGVQFSQLPCSDLNTRYDGVTRPGAGPQRAPLGLAGDSGGLPLYKNGTPVGGVGVIADGVYGVDRDIRDRDVDDDEVIALAATHGFEAPLDRRADRIMVDGKPLRFADALPTDLAADPAAAPAFAAVDGVAGSRVAVTGYATATFVAGTAFGQAESGIRPAATAPFAALDGFVVVDGSDMPRYPPIAATDGATTGASALTAAEVRQILASALGVANRARAQIRRPLGTHARVTVTVVDSDGAVLGQVRARDAPVFGADVSLQKARTAAFFSDAAAAADLGGAADAGYLNGDSASVANYVQATRNFLGRPSALGDGAIAFSAKAVANLARPYFPDGIEGTPNGPLSKPIAQWSPFSDGLQLDLVNNAVVQHVVYVVGGGPDTAAGSCTGLSRLPNGIQVFSGGVPIYRGNVLVGAIGTSGDGVDQDDMISFLGLHEAGVALGTGIGNAPPAMRADTLTPQGVRLRYVQCPVSPYVASDEQNVCDGK